MTDRVFTESVVEEAALAWLEAVGWQVAHGPDIALPCLPGGRGMAATERRDDGEVAPPQQPHRALTGASV